MPQSSNQPQYVTKSPSGLQTESGDKQLVWNSWFSDVLSIIGRNNAQERYALIVPILVLLSIILLCDVVAFMCTEGKKFFQPLKEAPAEETMTKFYAFVLQKKIHEEPLFPELERPSVASFLEVLPGSLFNTIVKANAARILTAAAACGRFLDPFVNLFRESACLFISKWGSTVGQNPLTGRSPQ